MRFKLFFLSIIFCLLGFIIFLLQRNWLVVRLNVGPIPLTEPKSAQTTTKSIRIFFQKNGTWQSDQTTILHVENNDADNLLSLIKQWIYTLQGENLLPAHLQLEDVAFSPTTKDAFVSFSSSLTTHDQSIMDKWLIVESLLKTISHAGITLHHCSILKNHRTMPDEHIDFSRPLPVQEFLIV